MTDSAPLQSPAAKSKVCFPLPRVSTHLGRHHRSAIRNGINLRSCELHHPRLTELLEDFACTSDQAQFYPFPDIHIERIASLIGAPADRLTLAAGSDALIAAIVDALGSACGRMILQTPNYFGWSHYAALRKLSVTSAPIGLPSDTDAGFKHLLHTAETNEPSLVVISNPNSPSGYLLQNEALLQLADVCTRQGHMLVVDECFAAFAPIDHVALLEAYRNVVLVRSFSKSLGLAGARIAVSITTAEVARLLSAYRTEGAVSGPAFHLLEALLSRPDELEAIWRDIVNSRERFREELAALQPSWTSLPSAGNYINVAVHGSDPASVVQRLAERGVHIRDTSNEIGLGGHVRFGIAHWNTMQDVLEIIATF